MKTGSIVCVCNCWLVELIRLHFLIKFAVSTHSKASGSSGLPFPECVYPLSLSVTHTHTHCQVSDLINI